MAKRPKLTDIPGLGPKMEEKLREVGMKTVLRLSRADAAKLAASVKGLSEAGATKFIEAAKALLAETAETGAVTEKKEVAREEAPAASPAVEEKAEATKTEKRRRARKKEEREKAEEAAPARTRGARRKKTTAKKAPSPETTVTRPLTRQDMLASRLFRLAREKRRRQPKFRHEQAHRWVRVKDSWRKVRGIDSATREKRRGRISLVSAGYRKPRAVRGVHPSGYVEVLVSRPADLDGLDPAVHAVRIEGTVGERKRQDIIRTADRLLLHVLNPGVPEVEEEEILSELDLDELEVD